MLLREDFLGRWRLHRDIDDRHSGQIGVFEGLATFRDTGPSRLTYHEEGQMRFGDGPVLMAERSYQWHFSAEHVEVRFADGSPFHSFVPCGQVRGSDHPCGQDYYTVSYDFGPTPDWRATWIVKGPRKAYTSVSRYHR